MNASDIMKNGHQLVLNTVDGVRGNRWEIPGVVGTWSARDVIAHLASFEVLLVEILETLHEPSETRDTPLLDEILEVGGERFNDIEVGKRATHTPHDVIEEYTAAAEQAAALAATIEPAEWARPGALPWYGEEYSPDDLIVYQYYGHKREHCAQIARSLE